MPIQESGIHGTNQFVHAVFLAKDVIGPDEHNGSDSERSSS